MRIAGVLFDKDGTLFDFGATWDVWADRVFEDLAQGCTLTLNRISRSARYDLENKTFYLDSPFIAGTANEAAACVARALPERSFAEVEDILMRTANAAPVQQAVPLVPYLQGLAGRGLKLGVVTNDTESGARAHLGAAGVTDRFDFIAGFDSGHGMKPGPGPLLAFAEALDLDPAHVVMVGDSTHDLIAGRRAGMRTIGVLTGPAGQAELAPLADAVLPDIGHIPDWLDQAIAQVR